MIEGGTCCFRMHRRRRGWPRLHDHDLDLFSSNAELDENGGVFHFAPGVDLTLQRIARNDVAERFAFVTSPAARAAAA